MAFKYKRPPIRFILSIKEFNLLIYILKYNEQKCNEEDSNKAKKFRERLLQYSIPYKDENGEDVVEIGFYNNQLFYLVKNLLNYNIDEKVDMNYYAILMEQRKKYSESKKLKNK